MIPQLEKFLFLDKDIFWINSVGLKVAGLWQSNQVKENDKYHSAYVAYKYFFLIFSIIHTVHICVSVIMLSEELSMTDLIFNIGFAFDLVVNVIKHFLVLKKQDTLSWLIEQPNIKPFNRKKDVKYDTFLLNTKKYGNLVTILFWVCAIFTLSSITILTILFNKQNENKSIEICKTLFDKYYPIFNERTFKIPHFNQKDIYEKVSFIQNHLNITTKEKCIRATRSFPFPNMTPYNNQISPYYELTFFLQVTSIFYRICFIISFDMILINMMMFLILQFKTIVSDLLNLYEDSIKTVEIMILKDKKLKVFKDEYICKEYYTRLQRIVKHHILVLKYTEEMQSLFTWNLFYQYCCNNVLIIASLIQLSDSEKMTLEFLTIFGFCVTVLISVSINCFCGSQLKSESENIATAVYSSNWEMLGKRSYEVKHHLLRLINRSFKPSVVLIGNMINLDLPTFAKLARASYSYYTFLSKTQKN